MAVTLENLDDVFTYHPASPEQGEAYLRIREKAKDLVREIIASTPNCGDRHAAIRHVREAVMTANAAIATNGAV